MKDALEHEKDDLKKAEKAYQDALACRSGVQAKIDAMKQRQDELCAKIKALEAESKSMGHELTYSKDKMSKEQAAVDSAKAGVEGANRRAKEEAAEAERAKMDA